MAEKNEFGNEEYAHSIKNGHIKHIVVTYVTGMKGRIEYETYLCVHGCYPTPEKVARNPPHDVTCKNCLKQLERIFKEVK